MNLIIREYNQEDLSFIKESLEKLHDYVVNIDPIKRIRKEPGLIDLMHKDMINTIKTKQGKIYIAESEVGKMGFIAGFIGDKQGDENLLEVVPSKSGVISDLFVAEKYRGNKIGSQLVEQMEAYLVSQNCDSIWVNTNSFNEGALKLYNLSGCKEREVSMMKKIN